MVLHHHPADGAGRRVPTFSWIGLPLMIACALLYVLADRLDGIPNLQDTDDLLRAIQIDQFWKNGRWYDLTLPMIRMPEPYISPWSRLVDLPYVFIARILTLFAVNPQTALHWSFLIWPPVMLTAFCLVAFDIATHLSLSKLATKTSIAFAVILCMLPMCGEFTPGRIDHHNLQILLLALMLAGIFRSSLLGGIIGGLCAAFSLAIGLECVPIITCIFGALIGAWIFGLDGSRRLLCSVMFSTAIATPLVALAFIGPIGLSSVQCDAMSAPYVSVVVSSCLTVGLIALSNRRNVAWKRAAFLAVPALVIFTGLAFSFPRCLAGPYAIIDPISRHFWFDRVVQEHSVAIYSGSGAIPQIALITILAITLASALPAVIIRLRRGRVQELVLYAAAISALLMTLLRIRFLNFADALVPLLLPLAVDQISSLSTKPHWKARLELFTTLGAPIGISLLFFTLVPGEIRPSDTIDVLDGDGCERADFKRLAELPPGMIIAPAGLSMTIAMHTPPGLSVAGIPFHRASPGLRRMYLAFTSPDTATRREALAPFDYIAVCQVPVALDKAQAPLYAALATGGAWPGLVALDQDPHDPLRVFRIDHDRVQ